MKIASLKRINALGQGKINHNIPWHVHFTNYLIAVALQDALLQAHLINNLIWFFVNVCDPDNCFSQRT